MLRTIFRYFTGDMDGVFGKVNPHLQTFVRTEDLEASFSPDLISNELRRKLDTVARAKHKGSVGVTPAFESPLSRETKCSIVFFM